MSSEAKIKSVLEAFGKTVRRVDPVVVGLIHQTYRVEAEEGQYALQGLHPKLATDAILSDYRAVTEYLAEQGLLAPRLQKTLGGKDAYDAPEGVRWRMTTWLPGTTLTSVGDLRLLSSAAAALGRFHRVMQDIPYVFRSSHPLHQTEKHLAKLKEAAATASGTSAPWFEVIRPMIEQVVSELPGLLLPELPLRVVHGDPKISNVLFDPQTHEAIAWIDLDTCTRHTPLVDLGDAIRSWCREGGEDEERAFSLERLEAFFTGYATTAPRLSSREIECLPHAGRLITLELTARFLTDVLEDSYFAWDSSKYPSRREHNLARSKGMLYLAHTMKEAQSAVERIVSKVFATST